MIAVRNVRADSYAVVVDDRIILRCDSPERAWGTAAATGGEILVRSKYQVPVSPQMEQTDASDGHCREREPAKTA